MPDHGQDLEFGTDGFVTYDELRGSDLDAARWSPARLPLPTGGEHIPLDPNAEVTVGEGEVRVTIPRFSLSHDRLQSADSPKYLAFSTRQFELPPDRPATFAVDLAVENIGGEPGDFRQGMAAFHVFDLAVSKRVFAVCGTSTRVFALHEQLGLGGGGAGEPFYHVVESPYEDFDDDFTRLRACEITVDRSRSTAGWRVDGHKVYEAHGTLIPEHARIGFGIWTMQPIRHGRSRSLSGQGMDARWRRFRVRAAPSKLRASRGVAMSLDPKLDAMARRVIDANHYMTLATRDSDGRPRLSPVYYACARYLDFYWVSSPEAQHSRNLAERPDVEIVIFDSTAPVGEGEAVYIEADARAVRDDELNGACAEAFRTTAGARGLTPDELRTGPVHLYVAHLKSCEVHVAGDHPVHGRGVDSRLPANPASPQTRGRGAR